MQHSPPARTINCSAFYLGQWMCHSIIWKYYENFFCLGVYDHYFFRKQHMLQRVKESLLLGILQQGDYHLQEQFQWVIEWKSDFTMLNEWELRTERSRLKGEWKNSGRYKLKGWYFSGWEKPELEGDYKSYTHWTFTIFWSLNFVPYINYYFIDQVRSWDDGIGGGD